MPLDKRNQSFKEEIANALTHGIGCGLAIAALPILLVEAIKKGSAYDVAAATVFGTSLILLYLASTLYHAFPQGQVKQWLQRIDHVGIYVLIAGTYTPFLLGILRGAWGWTLFGIVWGLALTGATLKLLNRLKSPITSTAIYLCMGWLILVAAMPLVERMPFTGLVWLAAGGISYTVGAVIFVYDSRFLYAHSLWHLFVIGGSLCHFFAAMSYAY